MFTQCSNCHTVFQLSAEVLRAAGGQVRCGRCGEIFSALARLSENANAFDSGESAYEMEERADSILASVVEEEQAAQTDSEGLEEEDYDASQIARLQVIDFTDEDLIDEAPEESGNKDAPGYADTSMEFTLPPGELDRIFIESKVGIAPPSPLRYEDAPMSTGAAPGPPATPAPLPSPSQPTAAARLPLASFAGASPLIAAAAPTVPGSERVDTAETPPVRVQAFEEEGPLPDIEVISDSRSFETYDIKQRPKSNAGQFVLWMGAALVSALLLAAQVIHRNREALAANSALAPVLRLLYSRIGTPLTDSLNLGVFQLRQWGVTGDPAADGTLRVRASILNTSAQLQPFPLLRLTLANRFGSALGTRDFEAAEYMGKPVARSMSPGEAIDAILDILDPGKDAEGFEIDVCLRASDRTIVCANDAPQARLKP